MAMKLIKKIIISLFLPFICSYINIVSALEIKINAKSNLIKYHQEFSTKYISILDAKTFSPLVKDGTSSATLNLKADSITGKLQFAIGTTYRFGKSFYIMITTLSFRLHTHENFWVNKKDYKPLSQAYRLTTTQDVYDASTMKKDTPISSISMTKSIDIPTTSKTLSLYMGYSKPAELQVQPPGIINHFILPITIVDDQGVNQVLFVPVSNTNLSFIASPTSIYKKWTKESTGFVYDERYYLKKRRGSKRDKLQQISVSRKTK